MKHALALLLALLAGPACAQSTYTDVIDGISASVAVKAPVRAVAASTLTLSGLQTVDGVALAAGDRVLVTDQTPSTANGIYVASTSTWQRARDFDGARDAAKGTRVFATDGASYAGTEWTLGTANPVAVGTSPIAWRQEPAWLLPAAGQASINLRGTEAFRVGVTPSGEAEFGLPDQFAGRFPAFVVSERYSRTKALFRSALIGDPGDTPEIGFQIADGTPSSPSAVTRGWPGAFIYWTPLDSELDLIPDDATLPLSGTGPFYGRSAQIFARMSEDPTSTGRGGAFVISTTPNGQVALRERVWVSNKGWLVAGGRASYEDRPGDTYPDTLAQNFVGADGLERGVGTWFPGVQGAHDSLNTEGWGNLSVVASDCGSASALAIRKYNAAATGFDLCYDWATDELDIMRVTAGTKYRAGWITQAGGVALGYAGTGASASLRAVPVADSANGVAVSGAAAGGTPSIAATGSDTNVDLTINPKGAGTIVAGGAIRPASLADAAAPNNSMYYSTDAGKLVYKSAGGSVNALY